MDNQAIANILYETADLLEVAGEDTFRIRSYRRAAESIEGWSQEIYSLRHDEKGILAIPGIGKGMLANLRDIFNTGEMSLHRALLQKYRPSMLELLKIPGLGPKTVALIWDAFQVSDVEGVERLARDGKLKTLPRVSAKTEEKVLKGIAERRENGGGMRIEEADELAQSIAQRLMRMPGVERVTPAGSLRRGKESVGDLDILVTGACCREPQQLQAVIEEVLRLPGIVEVIAKGENKVSFRLRKGVSVDVRLLPPESFGAALQYFTGSKGHNVALHQRALKMGYTLSEYALARVEGGENIASEKEEDIYSALGLEWIAPELRENCGEIEAAASGALPRLIEQSDIRGDMHAHTVETDGRCSILEMVEEARKLGYEYCAITDHTKNLAMTNGMDEKRALAHAARIREIHRQMGGTIKVLAGVECDILADGKLDLSHDVLDELDFVIGSVHSYFRQDSAEMTERIVRAISTGKMHVLGHPTGRLILSREGYRFDLAKVLKAAREYNVAMEHNAHPRRLDLRDTMMKQAKAAGVKIIIDTDSHHTIDYHRIRYGAMQLRRAWLSKEDVLNTLPYAEFVKAIGRRQANMPAPRSNA